jgi:hypothetical protein
MKLKYSIITGGLSALIISLFIVVAPHAFAQAGGSISGDSLCGATVATECNLGHFRSLIQGAGKIIVGIGIPWLVLVILWRFTAAWFAAKEGNASAYKEARKKSMDAVIYFLVIVLVLSGMLLTVLQYFGVKAEPLELLKSLSLQFIPITQASAQELPNFLKAGSLYDLMLDFVRLIILFIVYPGIILMWVWTGFLFVAAQGKPDALTKAKSLLVKAIATSFIVFLAQGFLLAARGTANKIFPTPTQSSSAPSSRTTPGTPGTPTATTQPATTTPTPSGTQPSRIAPAASPAPTTQSPSTQTTPASQDSGADGSTMLYGSGGEYTP